MSKTAQARQVGGEEGGGGGGGGGSVSDLLRRQCWKPVVIYGDPENQTSNLV